MWEVVFNKLKSKGLNPYAPGKHEGLCTTPYCVVKDGSQSPTLSTNRLGYSTIDLIIFVPISSYIALKPYCDNVKSAMKELGNIRKTGNETPPIIDDEKKAYTKSIEYQILKRLE